MTMAEKMKLDDILAGIRQEKDEEEKRKKKRKEEAYRWFDDQEWNGNRLCDDAEFMEMQEHLQSVRGRVAEAGSGKEYVLHESVSEELLETLTDILEQCLSIQDIYSHILDICVKENRFMTETILSKKLSAKTEERRKMYRGNKVSDDGLSGKSIDPEKAEEDNVKLAIDEYALTGNTLILEMIDGTLEALRAMLLCSDTFYRIYKENIFLKGIIWEYYPEIINEHDEEYRKKHGNVTALEDIEKKKAECAPAVNAIEAYVSGLYDLVMEV